MLLKSSTEFASFPPSFAAPEEDLLLVVKYYWTLGLTDEKIAEHSRDHFDLSTYGIRQAKKHKDANMLLTTL